MLWAQQMQREGCSASDSRNQPHVHREGQEDQEDQEGDSNCGKKRKVGQRSPVSFDIKSVLLA